MPLVLDNPEQVTVTTVRITSFICTVNPLTTVVSYVRGYETPDGWVTLDSNTATFDASEIQQVDPQNTIYNSMKDALYELLETRVGPGTVD